jgi:hypothetical protein
MNAVNKCLEKWLKIVLKNDIKKNKIDVKEKLKGV